MEGLTRKQILAAIPKLKAGSFELFIARAGLYRIGEVATKHPHIKAYVYPMDSVERIKAVKR